MEQHIETQVDQEEHVLSDTEDEEDRVAKKQTKKKKPLRDKFLMKSNQISTYFLKKPAENQPVYQLFSFHFILSFLILYIFY